MVQQKQDLTFRYKQVIVMRRDLTLSKGKFACQVAHAAVSAADVARKIKRRWWKKWMYEGQKKVIVRVETLSEMLELENKAKENNVPTALITDAGKTEIAPGTVTVLGIGPAPANIINLISGELKLV
ncbi:MAG: peptidyl-tRNA hydrolase Pth2 [Candidatus Ranarchaeia archaeon]|jgi:PTH2 family peptidyl-tRNA hydrolase